MSRPPSTTFARQLRAAGASHPGRVRENNEDRFHCDPEHGIFFVIDGLGGQAAGEKAAETAGALLRARLERRTGTPAERVREAIALANNEIFRLAAGNPEWHGMACVLTVALVEDGTLTVGHVGDTRLYRWQRRGLVKLTRDHSPVGEREDRGELSESEAMRHPRRHEVYRDVGSSPHTPSDDGFVEVEQVPFDSAAAFLLCTDGLSDLLTSAQMHSILERHRGDERAAIESLIEAANEQGGKDNVTAVLVAGERLTSRAMEGEREAPAERGAGTSATQDALVPARGGRVRRAFGSRWSIFVLGALVGLGMDMLLRARIGREVEPPPNPPQSAPRASLLRVGPGAAYASLGSALQAAQRGDTILVAPGEYRERVRLEPGVLLASEEPGRAVILPVTGGEPPGVAVFADGIAGARLRGFAIAPAATEPLDVAVLVRDSSVDLEDLDLSGARNAAVRIEGGGVATLRANHVHDNPGAGVVVGPGARPRILHNWIVRSGAPAIRLEPGAQPTLAGNVITGKGVDAIAGLPAESRATAQRQNVFQADTRRGAHGARRTPGGGP